jgi:hypothetical protein
MQTIGLMAMVQLAYSDSSITDTYNTGDTLTASTLGNIKSAVNNNASLLALVIWKYSFYTFYTLALFGDSHAHATITAPSLSGACSHSRLRFGGLRSPAGRNTLCRRDGGPARRSRPGRARSDC